ncbi:alcohol dehydrogenase catalytic domain-containing protein [Actinospica sp. MGRD01-02]|uniref:Alcohol dehydrogenase catalytic domain-containing protein n=1 Tax=Actinospica acidithermotolerans TaxID=2828514 RepID=A0A941ILN9_9ACTN|nr:alcohol dehydrogenase catalytic domain-containing protein [Actinospica acidithermotolerans]MBR7827801.1 alcohol dehydrogenase catalytic domain-containing protein [Actinospica acidithermotolerans]
MTTPQSLRVVAVGVCGSDTTRRRAGYAVASLGHEIVGHTLDGTRAAVRPLNPCRTCPMCRRGWTEQCPADRSIGRHDDGTGGFSGTVSAYPDQIYAVPGHVSTPVATLADPLACILHALHGLPVSAANVLVIGDGPMAALSATVARSTGARHVTVSVKSRDRASRLAAFGNSVVTARDLPANHYDVVVESAGGVSSEPILVAARAVAPLGHVVALGVYAQQTTADIPVRALLEKESMLRGSKAYRAGPDRDDFASALSLLAAAPGDFEPIISSTPRWSLDDPRPPAIERGSGLKTVYVTDRRD